MKAWTILALGGALAVSACSDQKRDSNTAYNHRTETTTRTAADGTRVVPTENVPSTAAAEPRTGYATTPNGRDDTLVRDQQLGATTATNPAPSVAPVAADADADNTRVNRRDRDNATMTPMDQGNSESDRNITAEIRKAVVGDGTLSFTAKNVKIITKDGNVLLRGPVKTEAERASILAKAQQVAGPARVTNQLEISK